jgi:hypothetical protein
MNFFKSLFSTDGDISSKRFAGLALVGLFMAGTIIAAINGVISESVESLVKTGLYTGTGLLGLGVGESMLKTVTRPKPVQLEEDEDK